MTSSRTIRSGGALLAVAMLIAACGGGGPSTAPTQASGSQPPATTGAALSGTVTIDGSSTVFPITELVAPGGSWSWNGKL